MLASTAELLSPLNGLAPLGKAGISGSSFAPVLRFVCWKFQVKVSKINLTGSSSEHRCQLGGVNSTAQLQLQAQQPLKLSAVE
jgi:hypothetical protein